MNAVKSVKHRIAVSMMMEAEQTGLIQPGLSTIVEATSGNTGIGLAMVFAARGYHLILTMPENMSQERRQIVQAYGAAVILTPAVTDMQGAIAHANQLITTIPNAFSPHQFSNPANPKIYYDTTGPSSVLSGEPAKEHNLQGIGAGFIPDVLRLDLIDEIVTVTEEQAYEIGRQLAQEGIFSGISTGAAVYAGLHIGQRLRYQNQRIVIIQPSSRERYLSTAMWANYLT